MRKIVQQVAILVVFFGLGSNVLALPFTLDSIEEQSWAKWGQYTGGDGYSQDIGATFLFETYRWDTNRFGIYNIDDPSNRLEIFSAFDSGLNRGRPAQVTLDFDVANGTVTNNRSGDTAEIGTTFGFYIENWAGVLFSDSDLNGGHDHVKVFDTSAHSDYLGADMVLAWDALEFLTPFADGDYNDIVVGIKDFAAVPAPSTLGLFGLGLVALWFSRRRPS